MKKEVSALERDYGKIFCYIIGFNARMKRNRTTTVKRFVKRFFQKRFVQALFLDSIVT